MRNRMKQNNLNANKTGNLCFGRTCFFLLFLIAFSLTACDSGSNTDSSAWKENNQKAYDEIQQKSGEWHLISTPQGGPTGVYCKIIKSGSGAEHPIQTASVRVDYTGKYYDKTVFDSGVGSVLSVNGVIRGFSVALQNMVVGDKWEICIPYYLGYGSTTNGSIPAYSTLFFEIELLKIELYPQ